MTDAPCFTAKLALVESAIDGVDVNEDAEYASRVTSTVTITSNVTAGDLVPLNLDGDTVGLLITPQVAEVRGGILRRPLREDEDLEDVPHGVRLPQDTGLLETPLQWTFTFTNVKASNVRTKLRRIVINASETDNIRNLATEAPVPGAPAVGIVRGATPWFVPVPDSSPQLYQAYGPEGPIGDPIPLEAVTLDVIDGGNAASAGIGTIDGGGA